MGENVTFKDRVYNISNNTPFSTKSKSVFEVALRFFLAVTDVRVKKPLLSTSPLIHKSFSERLSLL